MFYFKHICFFCCVLVFKLIKYGDVYRYMKLWEKGYEILDSVNQFTVGNDYLLDLNLVKYDCEVNIAHAKMLYKIGILNEIEKSSIIDEINKITKLNEVKKFIIKQEDEDCHTAIENHLVSKLGNTGKKIHTAKSRNDQVLTAIKLYEINELNEINNLQEKLILSLKQKIKESGDIVIPGYTHMQKAMPTNFKTWFGCFIESLEDNKKGIINTLDLINQSPMGSAAGFGVPVFNIDKEFTAKKLGFKKVQNNPIYCQHSKGKFEVIICGTINSVMYDLNKMSTDLMMYSMKEFSFVEIPKEFCTGSSIMPQKKNPDVLELIRAKYHITLGEEIKIKSLIANLISGYNRDSQLIKEPLMNSFEIVKSCLKLMTQIINGLIFNEDKCKSSITPELNATKEAYELVAKGETFRDAYKKIGQKYLEGNQDE